MFTCKRIVLLFLPMRQRYLAEKERIYSSHSFSGKVYKNGANEVDKNLQIYCVSVCPSSKFWNFKAVFVQANLEDNPLVSGKFFLKCSAAFQDMPTINADPLKIILKKICFKWRLARSYLPIQQTLNAILFLCFCLIFSPFLTIILYQCWLCGQGKSLRNTLPHLNFGWSTP